MGAYTQPPQHPDYNAIRGAYRVKPVAPTRWDTWETASGSLANALLPVEGALVAQENERNALGWMAYAPCALGDHYLAPDPLNPSRVLERVAVPYLWHTRQAAEWAVEQFDRQQHARYSGLL